MNFFVARNARVLCHAILLVTKVYLSRKKASHEFIHFIFFSGTYRLCEHRSGILRCPAGRKLWIVYANYGRTTGKAVCPHKSMRTTNCRSPFSTQLIRCACHGKTSCNLYAKNEVYGDPCVGTFKYIEVRFRCV